MASSDFVEMSAKSFLFRNNDLIHSEVKNGVFLRIERIGPAVAKVYFVNEAQADIAVPAGFRIIDHSNGDIAVVKIVGREEYVLGWTDNYSMFMDEILVVKLINQRQWALQEPPDRQLLNVYGRSTGSKID